MAFSWKRFTVWGICIALPVVAFVVKSYVTERQVAEFKRIRAELATCERCHKLFGVRAANSFVLHLRDDHELPLDDAIEIITTMYRNLLAIRSSRRAQS